MPSLEECEAALDDLAGHLARLDPDVRRKRIPTREVSITVTDLGSAFWARLDHDGLHDRRRVTLDEARKAQVRFSAASHEVVHVAEHPPSFIGAWLRGHVKVRAGWRDLLELRSIL